MKFKISKNEQDITTIDQWLQLAPPMGKENQWKDGRSAKELTKCVFKTDTLAQVLNKVLSEINIAIPSEMIGEPEKSTTLPWGQSGKRKHDLWLINDKSNIAVSIEAKADEPFGCKLYKKRRNSSKNNDDGYNMNKRLDGILDFIYGCKPPEYKENLYYQLLSATAGAILEAENNVISQVVVLFLVFKSNILEPKKLNTNEKAWEQFCDSLNIDHKGGKIQRRGVSCFITKEVINL